MRTPASFAALLALGWPARCMAEPLKVFDNVGVLVILFGGAGLLLFGLPGLLLLSWYGRRPRMAKPAPRIWPELTAERCALVQEACRARGLHLQSIVPGPPGLLLTVAAGTLAYALQAEAPDGLGGEALQDALVRSALARLDALQALRGAGGPG